MKLKPVKSRSVVINRGKVINVEPFEVDGVTIPCLQRKPLRTLGRVFDCSISARHARDELEIKIRDSLVKLNKALVSGYMKVWAMHHILLPQVRWDLMVYEIPVSWVERIEKSINKFVRLWFGLSKSLTDIALYSKQVPCPLPLTSLVAMYKSTKVNSHLQLRYSADKEVSVNARKPDCGRKWDVEAAVDRAESRILNEKLLGAVRKGRAGLGLFPSVNIATVGTREYRRHVVAKTMDEHEDKYLERAVQQSIQGQWTQWQDFVSRDIKWRSLYSAELKLAKFCIGATYNTLGTPANLKRWGFVSIASCALCDAEVCGIQHIL